MVKRTNKTWSELFCPEAERKYLNLLFKLQYMTECDHKMVPQRKTHQYTDAQASLLMFNQEENKIMSQNVKKEKKISQVISLEKFNR